MHTFGSCYLLFMHVSICDFSFLFCFLKQKTLVLWSKSSMKRFSQSNSPFEPPICLLGVAHPHHHRGNLYSEFWWTIVLLFLIILPYVSLKNIIFCLVLLDFEDYLSEIISLWLPFSSLCYVFGIHPICGLVHLYS